MYIIGIDEAGRGALAGPVVVAAIIIPKSFRPKSVFLPQLRDSKKLSPIQRLAWFDYLKAHPKISYTTARIYQKKIEKINIARAANLASTHALSKLLRNFKRRPQCRILLDGSLYILESKNLKVKSKNWRTIIRGDEKFISIKLASIIAKVTRDKYMVKLHRRYPRYQFNLHKGYGTELHRKLISRHGPAEVHRLTYLKDYLRVRIA